MKRSERLEKQKICDEFINKLENMIDEFENETGIKFYIHSLFEFETYWKGKSEIEDVYKLTGREYCYRPVIESDESFNYIYLLNINDVID